MVNHGQALPLYKTRGHTEVAHIMSLREHSTDHLLLSLGITTLLIGRLQFKTLHKRIMMEHKWDVRRVRLSTAFRGT
jgi:hypothetical protein